MKLLSLQEAIDRYGSVTFADPHGGPGQWNGERLWCVRVDVDPAIAPTWINTATGQPTTHVYMNKDMVPAFQQALQNVKDRDLVGELETFDGCLMVRAIRGLSDPSTHCFALALDINAAKNRLGQEPTMSTALVACFTDAGFKWGGTFHRKDGMHFQLADW